MMTTSRFLHSAQIFALILVLSVQWCRAQERDSSHVVISAIKSVSGEIPDDEFFAIHWKFRFDDNIFTLADMDIALSQDTTSSTQKLTEAGLTAAVDLSHALGFGKSSRDDFVRAVFAGTLLKIFNTDAYYGVSFGSMELQRSALHSSYFQFAYLRPFFPADNKVNTGAMMEDSMEDSFIRSKHNLYAEFFIHSEEIDFFKLIAIRGGVLVPLFEKDATFDDIQFRITIAVPVGGIIKLL